MKKRKKWYLAKNISYTIAGIVYGDCPHCKKPIIYSDLDTIKFMKKWSKNRINKNQSLNK
jgi:hypothetical protein